MKIAPLLLCVLLFAGECVQAQEYSLPAQPHLLVKGQAERVVTPDRFVVTLALQRTDPAPEQARTLVQGDAAHVLEAFRAHKAVPGSIDASALQMQPEYAYEANRQVFKDTQISRTLTATFARLADVRGFLADIQTTEHLRIASLATEYSAEGALRAQLKREAAEQSRASAQGLAGAYGTRITGLYTISDVAPSFAYGVKAGTWPLDPRTPPPAPPPQADAGASVDRLIEPRQLAESLEAGTVRIVENVYAIYLIAP